MQRGPEARLEDLCGLGSSGAISPGKSGEHEEEQQQDDARQSPCGCATRRAQTARPAPSEPVPGGDPRRRREPSVVRERRRHRPPYAVPRAGVEQRRRRRRRRGSQEHRDDDQQEERLHERVVLVLDGLQEHAADARVVEDVLDEDGAADDEAERHREAGEVGQDRVAPGVLPHDRARAADPWRAPCGRSPRRAPRSCCSASSGSSRRSR